MKLTLKIELDFESWFDNEREPKNNEEWIKFFDDHFMPESLIIGNDTGEFQDMIKITEYTIKVNNQIDNCQNKLRTFMEALEIKDVDEFLIKAKTGDYRKLGERIAYLTKKLTK